MIIFDLILNILIDIFNQFRKLSLFGLKNIYSFNGELINSSYILSLSILSVKIINKSLMNDIIINYNNILIYNIFFS